MKWVASIVAVGLLLAASGCSRGPSQEARDALQALRDLRSVLSVGTRLPDYSARLGDAKIKVDRYLAQPERGDKEPRAAMAEAIEFYRVAGVAWRVSLRMIVYETQQLGGESALERCEDLKPVLDREASIVNASGNGLRGFNAASEFKLLWTCASRRIDRAAKALNM